MTGGAGVRANDSAALVLCRTSQKAGAPICDMHHERRLGGTLTSRWGRRDDCVLLLSLTAGQGPAVGWRYMPLNKPV